MRVLLFLSVFCLSLFADKVEIESLKFETYEDGGVTIFSGNVVIRKGNDRMFADKVTVFLDKDKQIERFEAVGDTSFIFNFENNSTFVGSSDKFIYTPKTGEFKLIGDAMISDIVNSREIMGQKVLFYEKTKVIKVLGARKKPVKLIFEIDEEKDSE